MDTMEKDLMMMDIANRIEALTNACSQTKIAITFDRLTPGSKLDFSEWDLQRFNLHFNGSEYFFIYSGPSLLYVVDVTADSPLTAAHELMELIARKF